MQVITFKTITEAMQYIIAEKLGSSFNTYEKELTSKSVVQIKDKAIFIDENGLLD